MKTSYKNKYGSLELEPVSEIKPVGGIRGRDLPDEIKFSIDIAEQIALITENRGIQLTFEYPGLSKAYVMIHESSSKASIGRIKSIDFKTGINATSEIKRLRHSII